MDKAFDVLHAGIMCADVSLKIPYDSMDFSIDSMRIDDAVILPGGDATNASRVMARLGKKAALASKIGKDDFGIAIKKIVDKSGVDTSYIKMDPESRTTISFVLINKKGDRIFLVYSGSLQEFSIEDIDMSVLKKARHVNFGSYFAHPKMDKGGVERLFKAAKAAGLSTSADVTYDSSGTGFEAIKGSLRYVDYFMPSYVEGRYLTGETEPERMADFLIRETGDKTVVIKMGEEGCFIKSQGKCIRSRPFDVKAVDTTGAGDNFVAGFLTGLSNGWDLERCAEFANAVAGFSVQFIGAVTAEMSMERIQEFMRVTPRK
jgi:2-dehydro-3-deoxygluconokinase